MTGLSRYIESLLKSRFPQSNLIPHDRFVSLLNEIGLNFKESDIEYFDKVGITRPALRLRRLVTRNTFPKYEMVFGDIFSMKNNYYKSGNIDLPSENDYQSWNNYQDGSEEKISLYYHPFQFLPLRRLALGMKITLKADYFENVNDFTNSFNTMKEHVLESVKLSKESYEKFWVPRIGLLILLEEYYRPYVKGFLMNPYGDRRDYERWRRWRMSASTMKNLPRLLKITNLSFENVKEFYEGVATEGDWNDPLSNWCVLQRIVKDSVKFKLKNNALYAQHCYQIARMLSFFIFDLSGEQVYEPDEIMDSMHGQWKTKIFGSPFDYTTKKTQKNILDYFLIDRPFKLGIVFEGETEEVVIEAILKSLHVDKYRDGFFIFNARGISNIRKNLESLYSFSKLDDIELFLILDRDMEAEKIKDDLKMYTKDRKMIHTWRRDFEFDNFGIKEVLKFINEELESKKYPPLSIVDVQNKIKGTDDVLMKVINDIFRKQNKINLAKVISKKGLGTKLIAKRAKEILKERTSTSGWQTKLPIEKVLKKIFYIIPRHM